MDNRFVLYKPHTQDRAAMKSLDLSARGFVLFSRYENWSLVAHEAAVCGLPLLLPDLNWSRECFGEQATYFNLAGGGANAQILKSFYASARDLPSPQIQQHSWDDVARQLIQIYEAARTSR